MNLKRLLGAVFVLGVATRQFASAHRSPMSAPIKGIVESFLMAEDAAAYVPTTAEIRAASAALKSTRTKLVDKAACAWCLAMANVDREQNVGALVDFAERAGKGRLASSADDGPVHLPFALFQVYHRWRSPAAAKALAGLHFTRGVPSQYLGVARNEAFVTDPTVLATAWASLPLRDQRYLPADLARASKQAYELGMALQIGANSKDPDIKKLAKASLGKH